MIDRAHQLAMLLEAIDEEESRMLSIKMDHKARMETLYKEVRKLRFAIVSGQESLPLEPEPEPTINLSEEEAKTEVKPVVITITKREEVAKAVDDLIGQVGTGGIDKMTMQVEGEKPVVITAEDGKKARARKAAREKKSEGGIIDRTPPELNPEIPGTVELNTAKKRDKRLDFPHGHNAPAEVEA